jgi:YidC/Oxa1 family membrane protein insertase
MWSSPVEILRAAIFGASHVCGGSLGAGILLVSAGVRLALLPLTLRLARRGREQQSRLAAIKPEIDALQRRFANDPRRLYREIGALHARHDIKLFTPFGVAGAAIQLPLLGALFSAVRNGLGAKVRFLWIPDLARPNGLVVLIVAALTALGFSVAPATPGQNGPQTAIMVASVLGTIVFLWSASSAVALAVGANSAVSVLQTVLLRQKRD